MTDTRFRWIRNGNNTYLTVDSNRNVVTQTEKTNNDNQKWRFNANGTLENKTGGCIKPNISHVHTNTFGGNLASIFIIISNCDVITPYMKWKKNSNGYIVNEADQGMAVWMGGLVVYGKLKEMQDELITEEQRNTAIWYEEFE